jgi:hypothetical protein
MAEGDAGVVGGLNAPLPILMTMAAFLSIALYNVLETTTLIFTVFKKRNGLYFWSFLVANWGIAPHAVGFILKFFQITAFERDSWCGLGVYGIWTVTRSLFAPASRRPGPNSNSLGTIHDHLQRYRPRHSTFCASDGYKLQALSSFPTRILAI